MPSVVGFESPGGDQSKQPVPVTKFTPTEKAIQRRLMELDEIIAAGKRAQEEANAIVSEVCAHRVFDDREAFIYYLRSCMVCGKSMGTV